MTANRNFRLGAALVAAICAFLSASPSLAGDGCTRGPHLDWETVPDDLFEYHGINCYTETRVRSKGPSFYGDEVSGLDMLYYGFRVDSSYLVLSPQDSFRIFELTTDEGDPYGDVLLSIVIHQVNQNVRTLCVEWQDDYGSWRKQCAEEVYLPAGSLVTVEWVVDRGYGGKIEVTLNEEQVVRWDADNGIRPAREARIGLVDVNLTPPGASGVIRYRPEFKLFDFAGNQI